MAALGATALMPMLVMLNDCVECTPQLVQFHSTMQHDSARRPHGDGYLHHHYHCFLVTCLTAVAHPSMCSQRIELCPADVIRRLQPLPHGNMSITAEGDPSLLQPATAAEERLYQQLREGREAGAAGETRCPTRAVRNRGRRSSGTGKKQARCTQ